MGSLTFVIHWLLSSHVSLTLTITGRVSGTQTTIRTVLHALLCMGLLDIASLRTPPRPPCRAFFVCDAPYAMLVSAVTDNEARTDWPARRRPLTRSNSYADV
jgi:hypothetical protein